MTIIKLVPIAAFVILFQTNSDLLASEKTETNPLRVLTEEQSPNDGRLTTSRSLRDDYHPWTPSQSLGEWEKRFQTVRTQLKVANGLWPMPQKTTLKPVVHGKIERDDYTIEKVYFESYPGHFVTGNLYRPKFYAGPRPGILCPHGHWQDGRFYSATEEGAADQIKQGAEQFEPNARFPLQARMVTLARMGCVVFHYDMIGYADSQAIAHRPENQNDAEAILRLQNVMGLQTWNTIRALDFLESLADVDSSRLGVTGASGGGTQTFILCALDDRPAVAFPAVMVSTAMQGGCTCENCPLLRVGTGNVEFAAMFAPKPYGMSGADDWTIDIETRGLPQLKQHYSLYRVPENVMAKCYPNFKHNYNQVSREMMYRWMDRHLALDIHDLRERPIEPVPPKELSVFNEEHPRPGNEKTFAELRQYWSKESDHWLSSIRPQDPKSFAEFKSLIKPALEAMVVDQFPAASDVEIEYLGTSRQKGFTVDRLIVGRIEPEHLYTKEAVPVVHLMPAAWNGHTVVWVDLEGHAKLWDLGSNKPDAEISNLLAAGVSVLSPDVFWTGEYNPTEIELPKVDETFAGYTYGYNRTVLANRVHDILTTLAVAHFAYPANRVDLVGTGGAGVWALLAKGIAGDHVARTAADFDGFSFTTIEDPSDVSILPGAVKYGDLTTLALLAAPEPLLASGLQRYKQAAYDQFVSEYKTGGDPRALQLLEPDSGDSISAWLLAD